MARAKQTLFAQVLLQVIPFGKGCFDVRSFDFYYQMIQTMILGSAIKHELADNLRTKVKSRQMFVFHFEKGRKLTT
jgi:hypothetical protein